MAQASARRSFHGPLATSSSPKPRPKSEPLSLVPAAARRVAPTTNEREHILAGVLAALRCLTAARR
jgi:hypothetical protein